MSLVVLQKKLGLTPDGSFGPVTLKAAAAHFKLSKFRAAHFFAQTGHETGDFTKFTENLNYSKEGLMTTFKKYFPTEALAAAYARNPQKIANRVYGNRMGNGPDVSGDGYKYRGRGALQLTGKQNYQSFSTYMRRPDILTNPDLVATDYSFDSAIWFFNQNSIWAICDQGVNASTILRVTRKVNGGTIGLKDREEKTNKYLSWL